MDICRKVRNSNLWFQSQTKGYGIIKIARPCDLWCEIVITEPDSIANSIRKEKFSITSKTSISMFDDYTASLDDFAIYRYTKNVPNLLIFLKIIDGFVHLCVSQEGEYELTVKQLSNSANVIENAFVTNVERTDNYKDAIYTNVLEVSTDDLGKLNISYGGSTFTTFGKYIQIDNTKVIKITQTRKNFPSLFELFSFGNSYGPNDIQVNWYGTKWNIRKIRGINNISAKADNNILYISSAFSLWYITSYCGYEQIKIEVVDKPSNWDSMPDGNIAYALSLNSVNNVDIAANNNLLDYAITCYNPTNRCGTIIGTKMYDSEGYDITYNKKGTTLERPAAIASDIGFTYFDTTIGKPIYWNGTDWVDATGTLV